MFIRTFPAALHRYERELLEPLDPADINLLRVIHGALVSNSATLELAVLFALDANLNGLRALLALVVASTRDPAIILRYFAEDLWDIPEFFAEFWMYGVDWSQDVT